MERTRNGGGNGKPIGTNAELATFVSTLVARAELISRLGFQYGGDRDVYKALGYPTSLEFKDFYGRYLRQDMAKAIIDRPVRATWQGQLELIESEETEDTEFEKAWAELDRKLGIKAILSRLDRLTGIGRYGVLLLGLDDVPSKDSFVKPVKNGVRQLRYIRPFGEESAKIVEYVKNPSDERYGKPLLYSIESVDVETGGTTNVKVHFSRIIHVTDEPLESEIYGTPRLQAVFNRLLDLDKLVGGDAEMFWRGARPGYEGKVDPAYTMTEPVKQDLKDQLDEYENNLRRFLINEGIEIKPLAQQIADPSGHVDIILKMISADTGIPLRVLTGSERGELASTQDTSEWKEYVQIRRENHAEVNIVRPFVSRMLDLGVLPKPKADYTVKWSDLYALSEKARVDIGKARATALREYTYSPMAEVVVPPDAFFEFCLGLTPDQITLIRKQRDEMLKQEELYDKILEELEPEPVMQPGQAPGAGKKTTPAKQNTPTKKNKMGK